MPNIPVSKEDTVYPEMPHDEFDRFSDDVIVRMN